MTRPAADSELTDRATGRFPRSPLARAGVIACLCVAPIAFVLTIIYVQSVTGPFWLGNNSDPAYPYLFNSLMLAQGWAPAHIDHPGVPLKVLGTIVMFIVDLFRGVPPLVVDVLSNPEVYASAIQITVMGLTVAALLAIGFYSYRVTNSLGFALLIQLAPFFSPHILRQTWRYGQDGILMLCSLLLVFMVVLSLREDRRVQPRWLALGFALAVGFGGASKFLFLPLGLLAFACIPTVRWKIAYVFGTVAAFFLFTAPIAKYYSNMSGWLTKLFVHSGQYGSGSTSIIEWDSYSQNIGVLFFRLHPSLLYLMILTFIACLVFFALRLSRSNSGARRYEWHLYGLFLIQVLTVLLLAKRPTGPYLIPLVSLEGLTLGIIWLSLRELVSRKRIASRALSMGLIVLVGLFLYRSILHEGPTGAARLMSHARLLKTDTLDVHRYVEENYSDCTLVHMFRSSHPLGALHLGNGFSKNKFHETLIELYPTSYLYHRSSKDFRKWLGSISFADLARDEDCVILWGSTFPGDKETEIPGVTYEAVYGNWLETAYRLRER